MREIYDKFMDVLRDIDINSLTYPDLCGNGTGRAYLFHREDSR